MRKFFVCSLAAFFLILSGCNSGSKPISITIVSPTGAQALDIGQSFNISVQVNNDKMTKGATFSLVGVGTLGNVSATGATYNAPAAGAGGSATITIASAANPATTSVINITVTPLPSISNASPTLPGGVQGASYSATITTSGGAGTLNYSVTVGSLPPGLSLGGSSGAITGTPTGTGTFTFTVQVKDSSTASPQTSTKSFTITVNEQPSITSANTTTFVAGTPGSFQVTTTAIPTAAISESGALPAGVTFVDSGTGTATLSGTTTTTGTFPITISANNGIGTPANQSFSLVVGKAPTISSAAATTFTVGAAGTFSVTTTGYPAPSLSESGSLPSGVNFTDNKNGTATIAGTPAANSGGKYNFTITANNGVTPNGTQSFVLTVNQAPAISSANSATFNINTAGTFTVTSTGYPIAALSETGTLPTGVTFVDNHNGTATINGTSTVSGAFPITITANNGVSPNGIQSFTIKVNQAPAITSGNSLSATAGGVAPPPFTVTATGYPVPTISESGTLPSGVTFTGGTGTASIAINTATVTGGKYTFTINASNGVTPNATQTFTITINEAPSISSANATTFSVNAAGSFTVTTSSSTYPVAALSETGALPTGVTFVDQGNGTAKISGTATAAGTFPITITANNGISPNATQSFTLTVNTAPAFTSASNTTFTAGTSGTFPVVATGTPTPSFTESGALPSGVTFVDNHNGTATLSGTPAASTSGTYTYTFTITATNTAGSNNQTFTLTVDQAPGITTANSTTFTVGSNSSFTVMTTGFPKPALSESGALPSGVTFVDNGTGTATLSGTPASGTAGTYTLNITANNGITPNATQTFTLTVNTLPVFSSGMSTTFTVGTAGTFTVSASGSPTFTVSSGTLPNGVTLTDNHNGTATLAGTPASGTGAVYNFTIKATNGTGSTTQSFTLTVNQAPAITSTSTATTTVGTQGTFTVTTSGFPTPALSETGALPTGVNFVDNGNGTATLSGTPATGTANTYPITITANNGIAPNGTQGFTLTVVNQGACTTMGNESLLKGSYAFLLKGVDSSFSANPVLIGGVLTFNGTGGISAGVLDMNLNAGVQSDLSVTSGSYGAGSDQRGCLVITTSAGTQTYRFSAGNISSGVASTVHVIGFDASGPFTTGTMRKQSGGPFSNSSVTGTFAFGGASVQNAAPAVGGGKFGVIGVVSFNGSGGITGGSEDVNQNGMLDGNPANTSWPASPISINSVGSSYSMDASGNGRGTLTFAFVGTSTVAHSVLFAISSSDAFFMSSDAQTASTISGGEAMLQSGTPFSANPLSGSYIGYDSGLGSTYGSSTRADIILLGPLTSGSANISGTQIKNHSGTLGTGSLSGGTYSTSSAGRAIVAGGGPVLYLVNTGAAFFLNSNAPVDTGFFQSQSGSPFSNASLSGTYAFGSVDPEDPSVSNEDGVARFTSPNINGTSDDNAFGSLNPDNVFGPQTYSVDSTGLGVSPAECTVGGTGGSGCQIAFYIISPSKAVFIQLENSSITQVKANSVIEIADK